MLYLFLSSWLAIHASVSCHSFSVRLLTQYVRLPVPNTEQLDAAAARGTDFEGMGLQQFTRVPVARQEWEAFINSDADELGGGQTAGPSSAEGLIQMSTSNPTVALEHIKIYRELQANWQAHDAYARACLCIGTYTFLHAVAYYSIGLLIVELSSPWAGLCCVLMLPCLCWLLIRLDLYFASYLGVAGSLLLVTGPTLAGLAATLLQTSQRALYQNVHFILVPIIFFQHILLIAAITRVAYAEQFSNGRIALPTRFRTVLYLDVFGWLDGPDAQSAEAELQTAANIGVSQGHSGSVHPRIREALASSVDVLARMLRLELDAWEGEPNQENLRRVPGLAAHIATLRAEFEAEARNFATLPRSEPQIEDAPTGEEQNRGQGSATGAPDLWLRMHWADHEGRSGSYFVRPDTGLALIEAPEDGTLVSDIEGITERLAEFRRRVAALANPLQQQQPGGEQPANAGIAMGWPRGSESQGRPAALLPAPRRPSRGEAASGSGAMVYFCWRQLCPCVHLARGRCVLHRPAHTPV